jgi:hypothetical protein
MTASWLPPLIEEIGSRRFAFHPPVANVAPNDWRLAGVSVTSLRVVNSVSGLEVAVPKQFLGPVTDVENGRLFVSLVKELEFRDGAAWPRGRRVVEMPRAALSGSVEERPGLARPTAGPAPVIGIRLQRSTDTPLGRFVLIAGVGAALVSILAVGVFRDWVSPPVSLSHRVPHSDLGLSGGDDYRAVTQKLGFPLTDRVAKITAEEQLRALTYPQFKVTVLLFSRTNRPERYVGMVDPNWRIVHWVGSENSKTILSRVPHS